MRLLHAERNGGPKMTLDNIEPNLRAWLSRKGFTKDEDIISLEQKGVSLAHALLMLSHVLPRYSAQFKSTGRGAQVSKSLEKSANNFDSQQLHDIRILYQQIDGKKISCLKEQSITHLSVASQDHLKGENDTQSLNGGDMKSEKGAMPRSLDSDIQKENTKEIRTSVDEKQRRFSLSLDLGDGEDIRVEEFNDMPDFNYLNERLPTNTATLK